MVTSNTNHDPLMSADPESPYMFNQYKEDFSTFEMTRGTGPVASDGISPMDALLQNKKRERDYPPAFQGRLN